MTSHSTRRKHITIGLACLFLLLLGLAYWMELDRAGASPQSKNNANSISIHRNGHADITLVKTDSGWYMTTPYKLAANTQRIDPLLSLGSATFDGYHKAEVDLPATGLDTPGASIAVGSREFLLGNVDATGERRYALIDDKVSFVPAWVWSLVHGGVTAFSDLSVFNELPDTVYLINGNNIIELVNIEQWKSLQADRISAWSNDAIQLQQSPADTTIWLLSSTQELTSEKPLAKLLRLEDHTLINTQPGFAYAISNARLDALLIQ